MTSASNPQAQAQTVAPSATAPNGAVGSPKVRSEQELVRFEKLKRLREKGYPYPNDVKVTASSATILAAPVEEAATAKRFTISGRVTQLRSMGKAAFIHILDSAGKIQAYVRKDDVGEASYEAFKDIDLGDILEVTGYAFVTKTGEKSLHATAVRLLAKCLIPPPEKWHGLSDVEQRYRQRYVDLFANPDVREVFRKRAKTVAAVRNFLNARGFLEVDIPVLEFVKGGATAEPFTTHFNAINTDMVLRIAHELPLKKLIVGGFDRVYSLGPVFRNEGVSKKHNPEFMMIEFYQAYANFEDLMALSEELFAEIAIAVTGSSTIPYGEHQINFAGPYKRISMRDSIWEIGGVPRSENLDDLASLRKLAAAHQVELSDPNDWGRVLEALWGKLVEPKLIQPTFITHHPFSISPLARQNQADPRVTDRFELIVAGMELGNAFSELNDPVDQRERFEAQAARKDAGDKEACEVDEDFVRALEYGMPPTAGQGIGMERLIMLMTNQPTIREVLLFPALKPG